MSGRIDERLNILTNIRKINVLNPYNYINLIKTKNKKTCWYIWTFVNGNRATYNIQKLPNIAYIRKNKIIQIHSFKYEYALDVCQQYSNSKHAATCL